MKINNFNKIGGTEFRVRNQVNAYMSFANWISNFPNTPTDTDFKNWTSTTGIYNYGSDPINRLNMILRNALTIYKVIIVDYTHPSGYAINFTTLNFINDILNNLSTGAEETNVAFNEMLRFILANPNLNDAKRISKAFFVFENGDNFLDLYNNSNLLLDISSNIIARSNAKTIIESNLNSRKPSNELKKVCTNILEHFNTGILFNITPADFAVLNKTYLHSYSDSTVFSNFINTATITQVAIELLKNKTQQLLEVDYLDLFNRVMWGLNLSPSSSKKCYCL